MKKATTIACLYCLLPKAGWRADRGNPGNNEEGCWSQTVLALGLDLSPHSPSLDPIAVP